MILEENGFVLVGFNSGGLKTSGPDISGLFVAQKDVLAPVVELEIFAPARDGQIAPAAVARAGGGKHDGIAAVGEQLGTRNCIVRRAESAHPRRNQLPPLGRRG